MRMKILAMICGLILLTSFNSGCFEENGSKKDESIGKIISVTQDPENPKTGDEIIITAIVENCTGCGFSYESYFAGGSSLRTDMEKVGDGRYEIKIGPFDNGTEIWYIIDTVGYDDSIVVSDSFIIQIGEIERSNITSLNISNIHRSPQSPTTKDTIITVSADVTSNVTRSYVWFGYMYFFLDGDESGSSGGGGCMGYKSGDTYEDDIHLWDGNKGTRVFYKIAAQDESGNTAVSPTFSFVIS